MIWMDLAIPNTMIIQATAITTATSMAAILTTAIHTLMIMGMVIRTSTGMRMAILMFMEQRWSWKKRS
jgi:hypothetical protein